MLILVILGIGSFSIHGNIVFAYPSITQSSSSNINDFQPIETIDNHIVKVNPLTDRDRNRIHDTFEASLQNMASDEITEAIISFSHPIDSTIINYVESLGLEVLNEYSVIYALHVKGAADRIKQLRTLDSTVFIEGNSVSHSLLYNVTTSTGVRTLWQESLGFGYTGNPNTAIAILDTGIDETHTDANFTIVYWEDFAGADYSVTGDEYSTPTDKGEHGTHCAAIAAGKGEHSNNTFSYQDSGRLPETDYANYGSWFYVEEKQTVTINCTWEGTGTTFLGFWNTTDGWIANNYGSGSSISPSSFSAELEPGWYRSMYGNQAGAEGLYYSGQVTFEYDWTNPYADDRGPFAGVAPTSNIVGLKVLDDTGVGSSSALLNAFQWLYDYGQDYNVTVASLSLGWDSIVSSIDSALSTLVREKGIVCVVAAGNSGTSSGGIFSPASSPDSIAVGAVNKAFEIAYYSSNGNPALDYIRPDVVAPGGSIATEGSSAPFQPIIAADSNSADGVYDESPGTDYYHNNFRGMQGTSMACPFVAGLAQLVIDAMIERDGFWEYSWDNAKKIKQIISMGTFEVRNLKSTSSTGGESYNGDGDGISQDAPINRIEKDVTEGWGCVSPIAAVQAVTNWLDIGQEKTVELSGKLGGTHVVIHQLNLTANTMYFMKGNYTVDYFIDADLLLFDSIPDEYGDPVLVGNNTLGLVTNDSSVFSVNENGTYYLVVRWVDGNYEGNCTFSIEEVIHLESPRTGSVLNSGTLITLNIADSDLDLQYQWNDDPLIPLDPLEDIYLPIGDQIHVLTIYATDIYGTTGTTSFMFITDDTPPSISLSSHANNSEVSIEETIVLSIMDLHLSEVKYNWNGETNTTLTEPFEVNIPEESGQHILNVFAEDQAGNIQKASFTFTSFTTTTTETTPTDTEETLPIGDHMYLAIVPITLLVCLVVLKKRRNK